MDSAVDNAETARDPYNQGIYGIKRPKNVFDIESYKLDKIKCTFNDVLDICHVKPGDKCNPEDSTMKRILMLTDGDVDGNEIAISVICLMAKHCKPLVDAGMIGRILPPAYSIPQPNGKPKYVRSQREFFDTIIKRFVKDNTVYYKGEELSKKELRHFIEVHFEYDTSLDQLAQRYCCESKVMEYIAWNYHNDETKQKKSYWSEKISKLPTCKYVNVLMEDKTVVIDGDVTGFDYINIPLDATFNKHCWRFKKHQEGLISINGYKLNDTDDLTVYDIMHAMRKYIPKGVMRFKGLGELGKKEMRDLCLDPETRTVVIFKFKDYEKDMEKLSVIMSTKKEYADARADLLLSNLRIDTIDLDT